MEDKRMEFQKKNCTERQKENHGSYVSRYPGDDRCCGSVLDPYAEGSEDPVPENSL